MLLIGSSGWEVSTLQQILSKIGLYQAPIDGKFGVQTHLAVERLQDAFGIKRDGIVGPETLRALGIKGFDRRQKPREPSNDSFSRPAAPTRDAVSVSASSQRLQNFLSQALSQRGKPYVYGAETRASNNSPGAFDCSELVEWSASRAGLRIPDGAINQCRAVVPMSVADAINTPGALLFRITSKSHHVAISLGNGQTMEAKGRNYGTDIFSAANRGWTSAGMIPGTV